MSLIKDILKEQCPYCSRAKIFMPGHNLPFQAPKMYPVCPNCKTDLEPEPGYFLGAMYVSYALGVMEGILTFIILWFLFDVESLFILLGTIWTLIIVLSNKNLRWSRIIWLAIFSARNYR